MGVMLENPKKNKGIESEHDARELGTKQKGSNLGAMPDHPNQKEGIESRHDAGEPEIKKEGIESGCNARETE